MTTLRCYFSMLCILILSQSAALAQSAEEEEFLRRSRAFSARMEENLDQPFLGVTNDGSVTEGLFSIKATGVSTAPVADAARRFIATLTPEQRAGTLYPVNDEEWRKWGNQHIYYRQGISFAEMTDDQRQEAWRLLSESLSARGLTLSRDIMRLNHTLAELNDDDFVEYGEDKYWLTVMGEPSTTEPWGWQLDGHHLIINYFVLGDQVVMTPAFWGSEPVIAESGKYAGTEILQQEQAMGLAMIRALSPRQQSRAILDERKDGNNLLTDAFSDNEIIPYAGIRAADLDAEQQAQLLALIRRYVGNLREGHARVRMSEVEEHLDDTWFSWVGGTTDDDVYYYRIHSPVILIEFDHQQPIGLTHLYPRGVPYREHIHAVVRTPNGNDYGKDLLRQHLQRHPH